MITVYLCINKMNDEKGIEIYTFCAFFYVIKVLLRFRYYPFNLIIFVA